MRYIFTLILALLISIVAYAQPADALRKFIADTTLRWASVGVDVRLVDSGEQVLEYNSDMALVPASVTKLISTAFALDVCGADYKCETKVFCRGVVSEGSLDGSLIIYSTGDPTLDSKYFSKYTFLERVVYELRKLGINEVKRVKIVPMISSVGRYNGSWLSEDVANYYGASWMPFVWHDNSCKIELYSDSTRGYFIREVPSADNCNYNSTIKAKSGVGPDVWVYGGANGYREIRGVMPPNMKNYSVNASMGFPEEYFRCELNRALKSALGVAGYAQLGQEDHLVLSYSSPSFAQITSVANKRSVNLYVEALANIAAYKIDSNAFYCDNITAWLSNIVTDWRGVELKDASGLAPLNRVPVTVFTELLLWGKERWNGAFRASLAVAGDTGTLKSFAKEYPFLYGKIVAKSGSMSGVRALSGYLKARNGKQYAFTIIANGFKASGSDVMNLFADFLADLYISL